MNWRFAVPVAVSFLVVGPALAQNLLVNPNFDRDVSGWEQGGGGPVSLSWDGTRDAEGSRSSGSARASWAAATVTGIYAGFSQCVEVTAGATYVFGGKIFVPSGQASSGSAFFLVTPYLEAGCAGPAPPSASIFTPGVRGSDSWIASTATIVPFGPSVRFSTYLAPDVGGSFQANYDDTIFELQPPGGCLPDDRTLCFGDGRFKVSATFDAGQGNSGQAHAIQIGASGLLWFFSSSNIEVVLKVIDGCALGGHHWFFAAGLTDVKVTITVTDTRTDLTNVYRNPLGMPFAPIQDTSAFSCSP